MSGTDDGETITEEFSVDDLHRVRGLVADAARRAGLAETRADNLVTAVNEVAANAVQHAGGHGSVTVARSDDGVLVEISDTGAGLAFEPVDERPAPSATGGRGLWIARQLCRQFSVSTGPRGVTVRLYMPRA